MYNCGLTLLAQSKCKIKMKEDLKKKFLILYPIKKRKNQVQIIVQKYKVFNDIKM